MGAGTGDPPRDSSLPYRMLCSDHGTDNAASQHTYRPHLARARGARGLHGAAAPSQLTRGLRSSRRITLPLDAAARTDSKIIDVLNEILKNSRRTSS